MSCGVRRVSALVLLASAGIGITTRTASAQGVTLSVGAGDSNGGTFVERGAVAGSIAFDHGKALKPGVALAGRLAVTGTVHNGSDLTCMLLPGGSCAPPEPGILSLSAAAGMRVGTGRVSLSLLAGPHVYRASRAGEESSSGAGLMLAGTGFVSMTNKLALVLTAEQLHVKYADQSLRVTALMAGLRIGTSVLPR